MQYCLIDLNMEDEPVISGTGVTVAHVLEKLSEDTTIEQICTDNQLSREQVHAALSFAEMNLPHSKEYRALDLALRNAAPDDELDYILLAENAGSFSANRCGLHLIYRYKRKGSLQGGAGHLHTA